jgi:hypothetical protein
MRWLGGHRLHLERRSAYLERLRDLRREYGRGDEPFEIMLAMLDAPSAELYERAEDLGVTAVMCAPWMGTAEGESGQVA